MLYNWGIQRLLSGNLMEEALSLQELIVLPDEELLLDCLYAFCFTFYQ